jgi:DNA mismatch endonuclease (patch repair protein)
MAAVRGRGNRNTEGRLVSILRRNGVTGWRRHRPVFGRPDFVFPTVRVAVFVDGCFWHACPLHGSVPKTNEAFWKRKLLRNTDRDREVTNTLRSKGWKVVRIWQHDLKAPEKVIRKIRRATGAT